MARASGEPMTYTRGVREQLPDGDLPARRHGGISRVLRIESSQHLRVFKRRQVLRDGVVELKFTFIVKQHQTDASDGLGLRGYAHDAIGRHGRFGCHVGIAHRLAIHDFAIARHQCNGARHAAIGGHFLQQFVNTF
jgi:hypothetical protein